MKTEVAIYQIVNSINGKQYVGSTTNWSKRQEDHVYLLEKNKHHSCKLQRAYNKYGPSNFQFLIIESVQFEERQTREQYWIDHLEAYTNGYNCAEFAHCSPTRHVVSYDLTTHELQFYSSVRQSQTHSDYLKDDSRRSITRKGKLWFYREEFNLESLTNKLKKLEESKKRRSEWGKIHFSNLGKSAKGTRFSERHKKNLSASLKGKSAKKIICSSGITYNSVIEASESLGINSGNISSVLTGNRKTAGGFSFTYLTQS